MVITPMLAQGAGCLEDFPVNAIGAFARCPRNAVLRLFLMSCQVLLFRKGFPTPVMVTMMSIRILLVGCVSDQGSHLSTNSLSSEASRLAMSLSASTKPIIGGAVVWLPLRTRTQTMVFLPSVSAWSVNIRTTPLLLGEPRRVRSPPQVTHFPPPRDTLRSSPVNKLLVRSR